MPSDFSPVVYLLASQRNGTLYVGVTSNLLTRPHKHRDGLLAGFTREYGLILYRTWAFRRSKLIIGWVPAFAGMTSEG